MYREKNDSDLLNYKKYEEMKDEDYTKKYDDIICLWQAFLTQNDPTLELNKDYYIHKKNMYEVIRRCDKRRVYYYVFHDLEDICEYKSIALHCFWINTLKPFMVVNENSKIYNCANEMFSLFLILTVIGGVYKEKTGKNIEYPSPKRIKDIVYDFKYCSLSREAMVSFIETFADTYGVGISYILDELEQRKGNKDDRK